MTIQEGIAALDQSRRGLRQAVDRVAPELREVRPAPGRWSVAEVLEHLGLVERWVARLLREMSSRAGGPSPEGTVSAPEEEPDLRILLDRTRRVEAIAAVRPARGLGWSEAWNELERSRTELLATVREVDGVALEGIFALHFVLGPLNGPRWIEFVARHEERHARQVLEVASQLAG